MRKLYHFLWAFIGALLNGFPSRRIKVIGVTGTKGKTTVVGLLAHTLHASGKKVAVLSSVYRGVGDKLERNTTGNSMPGRGYIQRFLRDAVRAGCEYAVIEVTSQGVDLYRHRFIRFAVALITNLAPEHIEAHGSFENYREAKAIFLRYAAGQGAKVFINREDQGCEYFFQIIPAEQIVSYSTENVPTLSEYVVRVLPGQFGKENIAAVTAVSRLIGLDESQIKTGFEGFKGVPGRVEYVQREPFAVVVDYAHTPESLQAIYSTLRAELANRESQIANREIGEGFNDKQSAMGARRLICVLGAAGGGRDKWKRPLMGKIAGEMCDEVILTNEDPYDENPTQILQEIKSGISNSKFLISNVREVIDRREAIEKAISLAKPGDVVILTGKGSETLIHMAGGKTIPWNEREVVEEVLREIRL